MLIIFCKVGGERERERGAAGLGLGGVEHWCGLLGSDGHVAVVVDCWQSVLASVIATGAGLGGGRERGHSRSRWPSPIMV